MKKIRKMFSGSFLDIAYPDSIVLPRHGHTDNVDHGGGFAPKKLFFGKKNTGK